MKTKKALAALAAAAMIACASPAMAEEPAGEAPAQEQTATDAEKIDAAAKEAREASAKAAKCGLENQAMAARIEADMLAARSELTNLTARVYLLANVLRQRQGLPEQPAELLDSWRRQGANPDMDLPGSMESISDPGLRSEIYALWEAFNQVLGVAVRH